MKDTVHREHLEEVLEAIWIARESGEAKADTLKVDCPLDHDVNFCLKELTSEKLIRVDDNLITLLEEGESIASALIRRARLAKRLLQDVLDQDSEEATAAACAFEHILSEKVTDSICTLLGHPTTSPDGKPIPSGECCKRNHQTVHPIVLRLSELEPGRGGRINLISADNEDPRRLERLAALGVIPGVDIKLHQKRPGYVVQVGETTIALDGDLAHDIFVRDAA